MDDVDRTLAEAERDAARTRRASNEIERQPTYNQRASDEIERLATASSASTVSTSSATRRRPVGISRLSTQRDLERHPTELGRIQTAKSQHSATVGRAPTSRQTKGPLPNFGAGKPYPPPLPDQEEYVVEFDGPDDPLHAQNWPIRRKVLTAAMLGYTTMTSAFASSIFSAATRAVAAEFGVSAEVGLLGITLYVLGFAFGPTLWAPFSELRGRRLPLVLSMFGFTIFSLATATAKDLQTILICRFFGGLFGSCPLAVVAAVFSDMFDNRTRGIAVTIFSMAVFAGPLLSPFIGGFIVESHLGWRWTEYLVTIMGLLAFGLDFVFLQETYPPVILVEKAADLRRRTLNWGIHAKQEEIEVDFSELINKNFSRPLRILFGEPIVLAISIYMSFIYGLLYLFLTAYPLVFQGVFHFSQGIAGLTFLGMITGQILAGTVVLLQQPWYNRKLAANNGVPVPEWRLPSVIAGGVTFAAGIFWFGWSGYRDDVHWIVPTLSGVLTGFGLLSIFLQLLNYLVDAYLMFAASAIAGNTLLRSLCGAGFPLFATYMFNGMGIQWASTLLGCLALVFAVVPVLFLKYGARLRARSQFAPTFPVGPPTQQVPADSDDATDGEKAATAATAKTPALEAATAAAAGEGNKPRKSLDKASDAV